MTVVKEILEQMSHIAKPQQKFLIILFSTILVLRGRVNFLNLSRYCDLSDKTFRRHFRKQFDFLSFNQIAIEKSCASSLTLLAAQDSSFLHKSGKHTYGLDYFFNGCSSRTEKGLEVSLVSIVDVEQNTAFALSAMQTEPSTFKPSRSNSKQSSEHKRTRIDFYLKHFADSRARFPTRVKYAVFDGYFAKQKFVDGVRALDLHLVSKLRRDANLRYLYAGPQKKRGRRRLYDGKVNFSDLSRFEKVGEIETEVWLYTAVAYHVRLRRRIRVAVVVKEDKDQKARYAVLLSTDTELDARQILSYYKARFQIEFLFRDGKQHAGLEDCQARDQQALHFHFNAAMATVNLTKIESSRSKQGNEAQVFSMSSWKQRFFNEHLLEMIISKLEIEPSLIKNHPQYEYLRNYAAIAA